LLAASRWPSLPFEDAAAAAEINWLIELITGIRSVRSEMNVPSQAKTALIALECGTTVLERLARHSGALERLARIERVASGENAPSGSAQIVVAGASFALPLAGVIDVEVELSRLQKEVARVETEISRIDKKLANESFVSRAPEDVVEAQREKRAAYAADGERLTAALRRIREAA
jgi:valyl-tRNA synthetase